MHLELIDHLRCPRGHPESPLVAVIERVEGRDVSDGSLGCPVCQHRYPIQNFVADFTDGAPPPSSPADAAPDSHEEAVTRAAAMLDARTPGSWHVLCGAWSGLAAALIASFDIRCVLVNPSPGAPAADGASIVHVSGRLPFANAWAAGAAIDATTASSSVVVEGAVFALRTGGRLVAPGSLPVPSGARVLARDGSWWVAERSAPEGPPIPLRRVNR